MFAKLMRLRDLINQHAGVLAVVVVLLIGICLASLLGGGGAVMEAAEDYDPGLAWYYDLQTQQLFADSKRKAPPFENAAGNESVLAVVYGCGGCDERQMYVAYYEKYTSEGQDMIERYGSFGDALLADPGMHAYRLVSPTAEPNTWTRADSDEGSGVMMQVVEKCTNGRPVPCAPSQRSATGGPR